MHTVQFLARLIEHHAILVYAIIFICIVLEGEFILLCTGILLHLGALNLPFTIVFVVLAGLTKTFLGYYVGKCIRSRWHGTKLLKYIEKHAKSIVPHFEQKPFWSIFISKFLLVNHIVIIYSGYKRIDFKKYLQAEMSSTAIWAPGLLALGYFFSIAALHLSHEIWQFTLIVIILMAVFIVLDKFLSYAYQLFEEFHAAQ